MKICFFGIYDPDYARNRVLRLGFLANGYNVVDCRVSPKVVRGLKKYYKLWELGWQMRDEKCDLILVAFPGQAIMPIAWLLFPKSKIIFDAFLSLYDSNVNDRKLYSRFDPRAWRDWLMDWLSVRLAGLVLLDTNEHIKYFSKKFFLSTDKFVRVFVGSDSTVMRPINKERHGTNHFSVHFHGTYIPLQGIEFILKAAHLLQDKGIVFNLLGSGQTKLQMVRLAQKYNLKNVKFIDRVAYEDLPAVMNRADICLGIFGQTTKALRVIPNKVFEAIACGCPIITANTPAIREGFPGGEGLKLCRAADGTDLARAISYLYSNPEKRARMARESHLIFVNNFTPDRIVSKLIADLVSKKVL